MRLFSHRMRRTGVKAHLRALRCAQVPDLPTWPAPASFSIVVELVVGPEGEPGEETFAVTVCTPDQLRHQASKDGITDGRHHLIVDRYDYASLDRYLRRRVHACEGSTWDDVTAQLARLGRWEFEDYAD
ncbi:MAG: immunity 8 family protein [Solirubrobacteraceae bacterium]|nr:immunity 8 family protein [Solirubrobacteraceae bacterium]